MNDDPAWDKIVDAIDAKFGITSHGRDERPLEDRLDLKEQVAYICFEREGKQYKLERIARPAIIDKKSHYHKAASGGIRYENIYDPAAIAHRTVMYERQGGDWVEMDQEALGFV